MSRPLRLTQDNFKKEVLDSNIPVLVDFWSSWCPPCKMIEPLIDELALELKDRIKFTKLNVDQNPRLREEYEIGGVPTFILFREGKIITRVVGAQSRRQLIDLVENSDKD
jgi:thioredoxin 1